MSWAEKIKGWAGGQASTRAGADLTALALDIERQAGRLARHAEMAPNEAAAVELSRIAAELSEIAAQLRAALPDGAPASPLPAEEEGPIPSGLNHWARIVRDLQSMRSERDRLFDAGQALDADDPKLAAILDRLSAEVEARILRLRALVARADPQSLD
jgi:hypothetical protein